MSALLAVEAVSRRFRGLLAVDAVSFDVAAGEIFAVIGPNGAGKTTLFNLIAGALAPSAGAIRLAGERIDGMRPDAIAARGVGRRRSVGSDAWPWRAPELVRIGRKRRARPSACHDHRIRQPLK